jgi:hypothetical protein
MKTDNNYIYPETPEELSAFYGWECEEENGDYWNKWGIEEAICYELQDSSVNLVSKYRIPLPTLSDLKVGDVVRYMVEHELHVTDLQDGDIKEILEYFPSVELLVSRGVWVKVKVST